MKIANKLTDLIGNTPLLSLDRYASFKGVSAGSVVAKLEYFNPAGSVKDRGFRNGGRRRAERHLETWCYYY